MHQINEEFASPSRFFRLIAAGLGITFFFSLAGNTGLPCLFRMLFQISCPGCGMTRSWIALLHGDVLASFRYHPFGLPIFSLGISMAVIALSAVYKRVPLHTLWSYRSLHHRVAMTLIAVSFIGVWLIRLLLTSTGNNFFLW